jgi:hypothetical protein
VDSRHRGREFVGATRQVQNAGSSSGGATSLSRSDTSRIFILTTSSKSLTTPDILAHEGPPPEAILKAERGWRSRGLRSQRRPGRCGTRPPGTTTRPRGARCIGPEEMPALEARTRARKSPGGAPQGARPGVIGTRDTSQVSLPIGNDGLPGAAAPGPFRRSARPSSGRAKEKNKPRARKTRRGNEATRTKQRDCAV